MSIMERAQQLARAGKGPEALIAVRDAASAGDSEALLALGNWRLFGLYGERDLALAHELIGRAARAGNIEAARLHASLIGNGTGCQSDPERARKMLEAVADGDSGARQQLGFLETMMPMGDVQGLPIQALSESPPVRLVRGLLLEAECDYLCALAAPALRPSYVIDPHTRKPIPHPIRTSEGMNFGPTQEDLVVHSINRRLAAAAGTEVQWGEPLHMLRYSPGQEFRPHLDALPNVSNQRRWTVLVYLNDDYSGGETHFPELDLKVRGRTGDALIFRNVDESGRPDPRTRHAGLQVTGGTKWLATRWIRSGPFDPFSEQP